METTSFRFNEELKQELLFIKDTLNTSQSEAIKEAIHAFYCFLKSQEKTKRSPQELLKESGFIGSFKSKKNLSTTYKKELTTGLQKKYEIK